MFMPTRVAGKVRAGTSRLVAYPDSQFSKWISRRNILRIFTIISTIRRLVTVGLRIIIQWILICKEINLGAFSGKNVLSENVVFNSDLFAQCAHLLKIKFNMFF